MTLQNYIKQTKKIKATWLASNIYKSLVIWNHYIHYFINFFLNTKTYNFYKPACLQQVKCTRQSFPIQCFKENCFHSQTSLSPPEKLQFGLVALLNNSNSGIPMTEERYSSEGSNLFPWYSSSALNTGKDYLWPLCSTTYLQLLLFIVT